MLILLSFNRNVLYNFQQSIRIKLPEDDAVASKHVRVITIYKILFIYIYMLCIFVGLDNKLYKMHGILDKNISGFVIRCQTNPVLRIVLIS
jgi:hypothetical protein